MTFGNWTSEFGCDLTGSWVLPYTACIGVPNTPTGESCSGNNAYGVCANYADSVDDGSCTWTAALRLCKDAADPGTAKMQIQSRWFVAGSPSSNFIEFCFRDPSDRDCRGKTGLTATVISYNGSTTLPTVTIDLP